MVDEELRSQSMIYVKSRKKSFKGLFPGEMSLVEVSKLAGMLINHEEDFILCSKIEKAMDVFNNQVKHNRKNF
tara:strand:+ start:1216 stop:1434 length:219 start_codon:yes stop_codon:yes gene_type:complete